jgi:DNA polymerase I-like protein with 3'-5' exonuclease and polymerase domains
MAYPIAFDTETTGLFVPKYTRKGRLVEDHPYFCYPYLICFYSIYAIDPTIVDIEHAKQLEGEHKVSFLFRIDPQTRKPLLEQEDLTKLDELAAILEIPYVSFVGHNVKFDVNMVRAIFEYARVLYPHYTTLLNFDWADFLDKRCDDTVLQLHALDSHEPAELKPAAAKLLGIPDTDEKELKLAIEKMRELANYDQPTTIANKESMPYIQRAPKRGWAIVDTWLCTVKWKKRQDLKELGLKAKRLARIYCYGDCRRTLAFHYRNMQILEEENLLTAYQQNRKSLYATFRMEEVGVTIHFDVLEQKLALFCRLQKKAQARLSEIYDEDIWAAYYKRCENASHPHFVPKPESKFNPNSDAQLAVIVHDKLKLPCTSFTATGLRCMKVENILKLCIAEWAVAADEAEKPERRKQAEQTCIVLGDIVTYKKYEKAITALISYKKKQVLSHLFPSFNPCGTASTRLSSSDPNGQNVGKGKKGKAGLDKILNEDLSLRRIFGPPEGWEWYSVDYSQFQLAIFAFLVGDSEMIAAIRSGQDFHDFMARRIFKVPPDQQPTDGQRTIAKNVNFGYIFGAGDNKIEATSGMKGLMEGLRLMFPKAAAFIKRNMQLARSTGSVMTRGGYRLTIPHDRPHAATNYAVQGAEGEIVKEALYKCIRHMSLPENRRDGQVILQVHDEIVFAFKEGKGVKHMPTLIDFMTSAASANGFEVKVDAKYIPPTKSWADGIPAEL